MDENMPKLVVTTLQNAGHDVKDIRGTPVEGAEDIDLWTMAQGDERVFLTTDNDFKPMRYTSHHGLLIVTLHHPDKFKLAARFLDVLDRFEAEAWRNMTVAARDVAMVLWTYDE